MSTFASTTASSIAKKKVSTATPFIAPAPTKKQSDENKKPNTSAVVSSVHTQKTETKTPNQRHSTSQIPASTLAAEMKRRKSAAVFPTTQSSEQRSVLETKSPSNIPSKIRPPSPLSTPLSKDISSKKNLSHESPVPCAGSSTTENHVEDPYRQIAYLQQQNLQLKKSSEESIKKLQNAHEMQVSELKSVYLEQKQELTAELNMLRLIVRQYEQKLKELNPAEALALPLPAIDTEVHLIQARSKEFSSMLDDLRNQTLRQKHDATQLYEEAIRMNGDHGGLFGTSL
eukprot:TRINITY_DN12062_c0_g1_i1.p1 TRINITY_DN12062_c0_g1~~TRINITY_DN12062_c0_g1_i1.p1  ORF type:complete len:286 (+),score=78.71 TRINITY_DN12062_c0_g1_i1:64-921(+)